MADEDIIPSPTPSPPRKDEIWKSRASACKTVAVEGNIGCGKSTFLNFFRRYKNVEVLAEPVNEWKNVEGFNALDLMYKDAGRWSGAFQCLVTMSMLDHHTKARSPNKVKMMERTIYSTRHCFMENLKQASLIPSIDHAILTECHNWVDQNEQVDIDLIVYLRASPETCSRRIKQRNRAEESGVPLEYLRSLHQLHDDWLLNGKRGALPAPVLVLDADKDWEELELTIESVKQDILGGLSSR